MHYLRDDDIWEIECDKCKMRLTEVVTGGMPLNFITAKQMAWAAGWQVDDLKQVCAGCVDVSE